MIVFFKTFKKTRKTLRVIMPADHSFLSWKSCYNDYCQIYFSDKNNSGWFLRASKSKPRALLLSSSTIDSGNNVPPRNSLPRDLPASCNFQALKKRNLIDTLWKRHQAIEVSAIFTERYTHQYLAAHIEEYKNISIQHDILLT